MEKEKPLEDIRTSQRKVCELMGIAEATVKGWSRKGFRLTGPGGRGEIDTSRGRRKALSGFNAIELMLTIDLYLNNHDVMTAHSAAREFVYKGRGASGWVGGALSRRPVRLPCRLFPSDQRTFLAISTRDTTPRPSAVICVSEGEDAFEVARESLAQTEDSQAGVALYDLADFIYRYRSLLGAERQGA